MMKCKICGAGLKCTLTMEDPIDPDGVIIRRKWCPECRITYLTKEEILVIKKGSEVLNDEKLQAIIEAR